VRLSQLHIPAIAALALAAAACNPTKRVPQGERLLVRNSVKSDAKDLTTEELTTILKQKPNNKVLGQRLYLHLYNLSDPEKTQLLKERSDSLCAIRRAADAEKLAAKNARREARGKVPRKVKEKECPRTIRVWLREDVGEPPTVLDSVLTGRSSQQLQLYLSKEGYFNATVTDTVYFNRLKVLPALLPFLFQEKRGKPYKQPKAEVEYRISAGRPYTICTANWFVDDPAIDSLVAATWSASLLVPGTRFDADVLDQERTRITNLLRQRGYLFFTRELLQYAADTTAGNHEVDLQLRFERPMAKGRRGLAGTPEGTAYFLEDITMDISGQAPAATGPATPDTARYKGNTYLFTGRKPIFRPRALNSSILLKSGSLYSETTHDRTFRRLTNLRVFDRVDISYDTARATAANRADCRIALLPGKRQGFALEGYGTNRGGFLGTSFSLSYRHKNLFRSMGSIDARMALGLEAQQALGQIGNVDEASTQVARDVLFNTVELGPEVTIRFPRLLFPGLGAEETWPRTWARQTAVNLLYNFQRRPDYTRTLAKMSFGYELRRGRTITINAYPVDFNIIRIPVISADFQEFIRESRDAVLRDSYTDHVIAGGRAVLTLNTQETGTNKRNIFLWLPSIQSSGNLLQLANQVFGMDQLTDTSGNSFFTMAGVRFAQFVKLESDFRFHHRIHSKSSLAFRVDAGVGVPFGNLEVLPFESSFFSGGANGLRAWRARSVGPGSYRAPLDAYDRVGEVRLEGNAEYRFKLIGYLEGALFVDIGNIWELEENPAKPGSGIQAEKVPGELAFGTGIGARLNFDFFLVRFDLGLQTKDPSLPVGQRWLFQPKSPGLATPLGSKFNLNLGIGYPF